MASLPGNRKSLGAAGFPYVIPLPPIIVSETGSAGTDMYYMLSFDLAEANPPRGSGGLPVQATATPSIGTDIFYALEMVLSESNPPRGSGGLPVQATATATIGTDTFYALEIVLRER